MGIPVFTGDLALLDTKVTELSGHGAAVATAASDVHSSFGGLSAFYKAPEAEQLFATTAPVAATGQALSSELRVIAGALGTYSDDAFPLVEKLKELKRDAVAFRVKAEADDKWREDGDLVEENNRRRGEIAEVWAAFQEVERACHAKIVALVGGKALKIDDGSGKKEGVYGYDVDALKQAESLPWGEAVEESTPWWQVWEHAYDFGKGFLVDGVWGTVKGLGTLVGFEGGDAAKEAWTGLAKLATGLSPAAMLVLHVLPGDHSAWIRDSRTAVKETGKALIAWDQWGSNPSRAAGAVTFNVLTTVFTGGTGGAAAGAGKAGLAAKALSLTSKTARAVDPMTYVFKGAGVGLRKVGDVMAGLKGLGRVEFPPLPDHVITLPEGTLKLPDGTLRLPEGATVPEGARTLPNGTVKLPDGAVALPEGTVRSPFGEGAPYLDRDGNLYKEDGTLAQRADEAGTNPHEQTPDAGAGVPKTDAPATAGIPERELVGVGGRGDDAIRLGGDISAPVHVGDHTPGARPDTLPGGHAPDSMPRNGLDNAPRGGGIRAGDTPSTVGAHTDSPFTGGGHHEPTSTGSVHPETPGTGGLDDAAHVGDDATSPGGGTPSPNRIPDPPSFMRQGDNPYGPPGSLKPEQVTEIQVYRANHEAGYFKEYYDKRGYRHDTDVPDESGFPPPQLIKDPADPKTWIAKDNAPPAFPTKYYEGWDRPGTAEQLNSQQAQSILDKSARARHEAIQADNPFHDPLGKAKKAWEANRTPENKAIYDALKAEHAPFHDTMSKATEAYGEAVARHHVVSQFYEGAKWEPTAGPKNGNDQFDQVWRRKENEGFAVIEAKSDVGTGINERTLPSGYKAKQGSREYFLDIMNEMWKRAENGDAAELKLYTDLKKSLIVDKVEYILVKGISQGPTYGGFKSRRFNIGTFKAEDFFFETTNRSNP
ncbi:hypothetical protein [Streptomyces sp. NBC_01435]|uniref:hypothetical protein n=1 Tax=Streptomyces sp. NBC_01435 TaxID=2903865 RepID=UPI002E37E2D2|nr:hypothetical protein [Streptomyces sp. NBC_01435]